MVNENYLREMVKLKPGQFCLSALSTVCYHLGLPQKHIIVQELYCSLHTLLMSLQERKASCLSSWHCQSCSCRDLCTSTPIKPRSSCFWCIPRKPQHWVQVQTSGTGSGFFAAFAYPTSNTKRRKAQSIFASGMVVVWAILRYKIGPTLSYIDCFCLQAPLLYCYTCFPHISP